MSEEAIVLSQRTADELMDLVELAPGATPRTRAVGGTGPVWALVRCTSATAAGGSGVDATIYPATRVKPTAASATPAAGDAVWLTVLNTSGAPTTPTSGQVYACLVSGAVTVSGVRRPRAIAAAYPVSLVPFEAEITAGPSGSPANYSWSAVVGGATGTLNARPVPDNTPIVIGSRVLMWPVSTTYRFLPNQMASPVNPGMVSAGSQSFGGEKQFVNRVTIVTAAGDVTAPFMVSAQGGGGVAGQFEVNGSKPHVFVNGSPNTGKGTGAFEGIQFNRGVIHTNGYSVATRDGTGNYLVTVYAPNCTYDKSKVTIDPSGGIAAIGSWWGQGATPSEGYVTGDAFYSFIRQTDPMNFYSSAHVFQGLIDTDQRYVCQGKSGLTATRTVKDGSGANKTVTITGGIITAWES